MAIIYSYPTVTPTVDDLLLGTDVTATGNPTKNFTIESLITLIQGDDRGLGYVLNQSGDARFVNPDGSFGPNQSAFNFLNLQGTGSVAFASFSTVGGISINGTVGSGFSAITSTSLTGALLSTGQAGQIASSVQAITQTPNDNSTKIATTAYVDSIVDPSILQYLGDATGPFDLSLVSDDFKIAGTANQIETTAATVTGNVGIVTLKFPTAGITLPDGSIATTQAAADDSTKVATTAFVRNYDDLQDLNFTDGANASTVLLNSETLTLEGTALQVTTAVTAQKVKFGLPASVTIGGTFTGTTFAGDLLGTINTATIGTTQAANNDSTLIATTKYVDNAAGAKILQYQGDTGGPFDLNLKDDDLDIAGGSNISTTAATVATNLGVITIDLNDSVTITGTMKADTFTTTAGTATWVTTVLDGFTSITSGLFVGDAGALLIPPIPPWPVGTTANVQFQGNASTANQLKLAGTVSMSGDTVAAGVTYTNGGNVPLVSTISDSVVYNKTLAGFNATTGSVQDGDSIIEALERLQGQITNLPQGIVYQGIWEAGTAGITSAAISGTTITLNTAPTQTVVVGMTVTAPGISSAITVTGVTSQTNIQVSASVTLGSGITVTFSRAGGYPDLTVAGKKVNGHYYIVNVAGNATPNSPTSSIPNEWDVRDWCVFADDGVGSGVDEWQKIDNSSLAGGSGTTNTITKWTNNQVIGNSTITDDGSTVTIADTVDFITQGNNTFGNTSADVSSFLGNVTLSENLILAKGLSLGSSYGSAGQVLTSGGNINIANTWTTPTIGTVTSVALTETGDALTITGSPVTSSGTINIAGAGASTQYINGELNLITFPTVDNYQYWVLSDGTNTTNINSTNTATFAGASGITVSESSGTLTITGSAQPGTGTQYTLPVWSTTTSLGDSMVSQNSGGTELTVAGDVLVEDNLYLTDAGTVRGKIQLNSSDRDNVDIKAVSLGSTMNFFTADTLALTLDSSQNATFAGSVDAGTGIRIKTDTDAVIESIVADKSILFKGTDGATAITALKLDIGNSGDAAFNRSVVLENGGSFRINDASSVVRGRIKADVTDGLQLRASSSNTPTSTERGLDINNDYSLFQGEVIIAGTNPIMEMVRINSTTTSGSTVFKVGDSTNFAAGYKANSEFQGNVDIKGDLTVDGHIIHGGGGGGTGKGGTFTKLYTTGNAGLGQVAFTISRATTGVMIFDVMLTSDTSTACAVAKKYTVVKSYGASPLYNKILDTGPDFDTSDFNVVFAQDTTDFSIKCTITPVYTNTQKIGITLDLGFAQHDATVVMN